MMSETTGEIGNECPRKVAFETDVNRWSLSNNASDHRLVSMDIDPMEIGAMDSDSGGRRENSPVPSDEGAGGGGPIYTLAKGDKGAGVTMG